VHAPDNIPNKYIQIQQQKYFWVKKITKADFKKLDILLIGLASFILVGGTVISQVILMS
jgi:hypothetical protein